MFYVTSNNTNHENVRKMQHTGTILRTQPTIQNVKFLKWWLRHSCCKREKVKFTLSQATNAQKGRRGITLLCL